MLQTNSIAVGKAHGNQASRVPEEGLKTCSKCRTPQPEMEFYRARHKLDGREDCCKSCSRERRSKQLAANPLCTICKIRFHQPSHHHCWECQRARQNGNCRNGLCNRCKSRPRRGRTLCEVCENMCPKCNIRPRAPSAVWCNVCINESGKARRLRTHGLPRKKRSIEQQIKRCARNKVYMAKLLGRLIPKPCCVCGKLETDGHHHKGYSPENSMDLLWFCRLHHRAYERWERLTLTKEGKRIDGRAITD